MGCQTSKSGKGTTTDAEKQQQKQKGQEIKANGIPLKVDGKDTEKKIQDSTIFMAQTPANRQYEAPKQNLEGETASKDNLRTYYKLGKVQGTGSFGSVRIANSRSEESRKFAIKTIAKDRMGEKQYMLRRELEILKTLDHPNVIKFYEIFHDDQYIHFVMEYCNGGDIYNTIMKNGYFKELEAAQIMQKIFSALAHMHSKNVIHRDLKPENLLFASKDEGSELKIIDFGLSRIFQPDFLKALPSVVGTPLYVAPEVIEETYYGKECDNWSLGVVTYFILCGKEPFYARSIGEVYKKIRNADFQFVGSPWDTISENAKDLIRKLLVVDPKKRMTAQEALKHPWFDQTKRQEEPSKVELMKHQFFIQNILDNHGHKPILKLKKEVIKILINHYVTDNELQILHKTFRLLDYDKNGELTFKEMKRAMTILGSKQQDIENMRQAFINIHQNYLEEPASQDTDDENLVLYESEFMHAAFDLKKYLKKENLMSLFKFFTKSSDEYIDLDDVREVIAREGRKLQEPELEDIMVEVSMEKRGTISFDLFQIMMKEDDIAKVQLSSVKMQKVKSTTKKKFSTFKNQ